MNRNIYEIRKASDPWGAECYFGYKNGRQYTDAYDTLSELLEDNDELTYTLETLCRAYDKHQISKEDFLNSVPYYLSAEEKSTFIEGTELALDMSTDLPASELELYEHLIKERANEFKPANAEQTTKTAEAWHQLGDAFIEAYEEIHDSPETYTVSYTSDANDWHKRDIRNCSFDNLDDALEAYVKSRNAATADDIVTVYDAKWNKFVDYSEGKETVFLSNFKKESDKQKAIDTFRKKVSIPTPEINHGR